MPAAVSTKPAKRRFRYARAATPPAGQITPRDVEIVRQVMRHRFLTTQQIADLLEAPVKKIVDRLTFLYHHAYLDRPHEHRKFYRPGGGSDPMVYALATRGAQLLIDHGFAADPSLDWSRKNREATHRFIEHTIGIADLRVALVRAVRARPGFQLVEPEQLIAAMPPATQAMKNPWLWKAHVTRQKVMHEISLVPDYAFKITFPDGRPRRCLVEYDRGTMPIDRADLRQSSVLKKFLGYAAGRQAKLHQRQFGWKALRILVVTNTPERAANMIAALHDQVPAHGHDAFLITDRMSLAGTDILSHPWRDGRRHVHTLA